MAYAPLRKVKRAVCHINNLRQAIDAYLAEHPFKLVIKIKRRAGRIELVPKTYKPIPDDLSLIIGDAIHNLAAALDITLYGMARDRAPSPDKIMFPFPKRGALDALEGAINNGQVKFAGSNVADAIRALKPYDGGHPVLSGLHALDVRDKHHLLILTRYVPVLTGDDLGKVTKKFTGVEFVGPGRLHFQTPEDTPIFTYRKRFVLLGMGDSEEEADAQPVFNIAFGEGPSFYGRPVLSTLDEMTRAVEDTIDILVRAYRAPGNIFP